MAPRAPYEPPSDAALTGEARSALERFCHSTDPVDHDLYPLVSALCLIQNPDLAEALTNGAAPRVNARLREEWGSGLYVPLRDVLREWRAAVDLFRIKLHRNRSCYNQWDPAEEDEAAPLLGTLIGLMMLGLRAQQAGFHLAFHAGGRYLKSEWSWMCPPPSATQRAVLDIAATRDGVKLTARRLDAYQARTQHGMWGGLLQTPAKGFLGLKMFLVQSEGHTPLKARLDSERWGIRFMQLAPQAEVFLSGRNAVYLAPGRTGLTSPGSLRMFQLRQKRDGRLAVERQTFDPEAAAQYWASKTEAGRGAP